MNIDEFLHYKKHSQKRFNEPTQQHYNQKRKNVEKLQKKKRIMF